MSTSQMPLHCAPLWRWLLVLGLLTTAACGSEDPEPGPMPPAKGTAVLRFSASSTVRSSMNLVDPLKGTVHGALYLAEDVSVAGPREGAQDFGGVKLDVDLEMADPSQASFTTPQLDPNLYVFLGFFDVDANGDQTEEPDPGDPVTLPFNNKFEITSSSETALTVSFDLVYN